MYQSLVAYDEKGDLQGVLASEWSSKQGNAVWVFNLRQGVKFHNGKEMSAEDVLWSVNYIMDPDNGAWGFGVLSRTVNVATSWMTRPLASNPSVTRGVTATLTPAT